MGDDDYAPVGTPLYKHIRDAWSGWMREFTKNEQHAAGDGIFELAIWLKKDIDLIYRQERIGDARYLETLIITAGSARIEQVSTCSESQGRFYKAVPSKGSPEAISYDRPPEDISVLIERIADERTANNFVKAFKKKFEQIIDLDCDHVFFYTELDFAYLGDKKLLDKIKAADDIESGVRTAYTEHIHGKTILGTVDSIEAAFAYFKDGERNALFTTEQHASKLLWMAGLDYNRPPEDNLIRINGFEIALADSKKYWKLFMDRLFCTSVYDIVADVLNEKKETIMNFISAAEELRLVNREEQMEGIRRSLEKAAGSDKSITRMAPKDIRDIVEITTGKQLEDVLGITTTRWYEDASSEFNIHAHETMIYKEKLWWDVLKEHVGMIFEDSLSMPEREDGESENIWKTRVKKWSARRPDWVQHVSEAFTMFHPQLDRLDYDSFLYIAPERYPKDDGGRWEERRTGVGNMIVDFGNSGLFDWTNFNSQNMEGHLMRFYEEHMDDITVSLFRGHFLRPVLERMFRKNLPEGGTVAVAACDRREAEIAEFCEHKEGRTFTYTHDGGTVEVVLLDRPIEYFDKKRKMIL